MRTIMNKKTAANRESALARRRTRSFFTYIMPWLIGFLGLTLFPMLFSLYLSFTDSSIGAASNFIGFENYINIFKIDPDFWRAVRNTLAYVGVFVPLSTIFNITIAMVLNQKLKGRGLYRVAFYIPSVCAGVAVTLLWGWIFNADYGILNSFLSWFGIEGPSWLVDPKWSMWAIVIVNLWTQGNTIIIYLAGLQDIPVSLYESAQIDGATWWQKTRKITLPLLTPTIYFNVLLCLIGASQMFNQPYLLTKGLPGEETTYTYMMHTYNNAFRFGNNGYACALSWILLVTILCFTLIYQSTSKYWVNYSTES